MKSEPLFRSLITVMCLLLLSACNQYHLIKDSGRQTIHDAYSVATQISWNQFPSDDFESWTVDGILLNQLRFSKGIQDGHTLLHQDNGDEGVLRTFRTTMSPNEVVELFTDSLSQDGAVNLQARNLRPFAFGASQGFRFDLSYQTADGLEMDALISATIKDEKLYFIIYNATHEYYFTKYQNAVEALLESIQWNS